MCYDVNLFVEIIRFEHINWILILDFRLKICYTDYVCEIVENGNRTQGFRKKVFHGKMTHTLASKPCSAVFGKIHLPSHFA